MPKINNNQMREFTTHQRTFETNNGLAFANRDNRNQMYVVYSYGEHFPMYAYDSDTEHWFGNSSKYSPTTSKHQKASRPDTSNDHPIAWLPTDELVSLVALGGYAPYCAERCAS